MAHSFHDEHPEAAFSEVSKLEENDCLEVTPSLSVLHPRSVLLVHNPFTLTTE